MDIVKVVENSIGFSLIFDVLNKLACSENIKITQNPNSASLTFSTESRHFTLYTEYASTSSIMKLSAFIDECDTDAYLEKSK